MSSVPRLRGATLGGRLALLDADRLVGRAEELALLEDMLGGRRSERVLYVRGPAGIGKSTLLRAAARRGAERGFAVLALDPLAASLEPVLAEERPLVLVDDYDPDSPLGAKLRAELSSLSEHAVVVIAGRRAPDPGWFAGGWDTLIVDHKLGGLSREDARALLGLRGHPEGEAMEAALDRAAGSPLALTLARADRNGRGASVVLRQIAGPELDVDADHGDALAVVAIAREVTRPMLAAIVGDDEARDAWPWLAGRSFVETVGSALFMHDLAKRAIVEHLGAHRPEREAELRRRIVDHLYERALAGESLLTIDIAALTTDPMMRWLYNWDGCDRYRVDAFRGEADAAALAQAMASRGAPERWALAARTAEAVPEAIFVIRDEGGAPCGYGLSTTASSVPAGALEDPLLGPAIAHVRGLRPGGEAVLMHEIVDLSSMPGGAARSTAPGMLRVGAVLRSVLPNPRWVLLRVEDGPHADHAMGRLSATPVPALDLTVDGVALRTYLVDLGDDGMLAAQRAVIYGDIGIPPGMAPTQPAPAPLDPDAVREALRSLHEPTALASSPLASGATVDERAASVRRVVESAVTRTFGDGERERGLREVIEAGYLSADETHEQVADRLYIGRATYFRRLRQATERLTATIVADHAAGRVS
jgi:hypothetical protein